MMFDRDSDGVLRRPSNLPGSTASTRTRFFFRIQTERSTTKQADFKTTPVNVMGSLASIGKSLENFVNTIHRGKLSLHETLTSFSCARTRDSSIQVNTTHEQSVASKDEHRTDVDTLERVRAQGITASSIIFSNGGGINES